MNFGFKVLKTVNLKVSQQAHYVFFSISYLIQYFFNGDFSPGIETLVSEETSRLTEFYLKHQLSSGVI
jgi:hypothetical protein